MGDIVQRLNRYIEERERMTGYTDEIHGLHAGSDREAILTFSDLKDAVNELADLRASRTRADTKGK